MAVSGSHRIAVATTFVVVLACALVVWAALHGRQESERRTTPAASAGSPAPTAAAPAAAVTLEALAVLRAWDRDRSTAWAHGDVAALRALYPPRSATGRADVAMLRRWQARGLRVEGMAMQVLDVEVRARSSGRWVLVVRDRLVGATAVGRGRRVVLPRDGPTTRRLELRRAADPGQWVLVSAVEVRSARGRP